MTSKPRTERLERPTPVSTIDRVLRPLLPILLGLLVLWALAVSLPYYVRLPVTFDITATDNGLFSEMARTLARGGVLYRDLWDTKPPGMFILMSPFIQALGNTSLAIAASILFMNILFVGSIMALAYAISGSRTAALIGGAYALLFSTVFDIPETTVPMAAFGAVAMTLTLLGRGRLGWMVAAGAVFAFGVVTKQPLVFELPVLLAFAVLRAPSGRAAKLRALAGVIGGGAAAAIVVIGWAASNGSLLPMWRHVIGTAGSYVTGTDSVASSLGERWSYFQEFFLGATLPLMAVYFLLAGGAALLLLIRRRRDRTVWIALAWIVLSFAGASVAQAFKPYYFRQMLPALVALIALAVPVVQHMAPSRQALFGGMALIAALWFGYRTVGLPPATVSTPPEVAEAQVVVAYIEQHTQPDDCLWLWGNLARFSYLSGRRSCVSAIHEGFIMNSSVFPVVPARIEFMHELFDHPPALHILHSPWGYFDAEQKFADRYLGALVLTSGKDAVFAVDMAKFHRFSANFDNEIGLFGYDLPPKATYCPGDTLHLALTWQQLSTPKHEYQMFAKLITDDETAQIAAYSGVPVIDKPTNGWVDTNELLLGPTFDLQIPPGTLAASYKLVTGLFDTASPDVQLKTLDANGQPIEGYAELQRVVVQCP